MAVDFLVTIQHLSGQLSVSRIPIKDQAIGHEIGSSATQTDFVVIKGFPAVFNRDVSGGFKDSIMEENKSKAIVVRVPKTAMEIQGELCKLFYKEFKDKSIPPIKKVFWEYGMQIGHVIRNKVSNKKNGEVDFRTGMKAYLRPAMKRTPLGEIIKFTGVTLHIKAFSCPWALENAGQKLCEAMMEMDSGILESIFAFKVDIKLLKTIADGYEYCEAIYIKR